MDKTVPRDAAHKAAADIDVVINDTPVASAFYSMRLGTGLRRRLDTLASETDRTAAGVVRHLIRRAVVTSSGIQLTPADMDVDPDLTNHPLLGSHS